ncbi:MAG: hypothetical protein AAFX99_17680 [Myxococcota bacterium]
MREHTLVMMLIVLCSWSGCSTDESDQGGGILGPNSNGGGLLGPNSNGGILGGNDTSGGGILGGEPGTSGSDSNGQTTPMCEPPREVCGGACVDTLNHPEHCGVCGQACDSGATCRAGVCERPSSVGQDCSNTPCAGLTYCDLATLTCQSGCIEDAQCAGALGEATCDVASRTCLCEATAHACGELCMPSDSPQSCGDRCDPCPQPQSGGGSSDCMLGSCSFSCYGDALYACGSGCCEGDAITLKTRELGEEFFVRSMVLAGTVDEAGRAYQVVHYERDPYSSNPAPFEEVYTLMTTHDGRTWTDLWTDPGVAASPGSRNNPDFAQGLGLAASSALAEAVVVSLSYAERTEQGWERMLNLTRVGSNGAVLGTHRVPVDRDAGHPQVVMDRNGDLHIALSGEHGLIVYVWWSRSTETAVTETLPVPDEMRGPAMDLQMRVDGSSTPHIVFTPGSEGGIHYATRSSNGTWSFDTIDTQGPRDMDLALGQDGSQHVLYHNEQTGEVVYASRRSVGGVWSIETVMTTVAAQRVPVKLVYGVGVGPVAVLNHSSTHAEPWGDWAVLVYRRMGNTWRFGTWDITSLSQMQAYLDGEERLHLFGTTFDDYLYQTMPNLEF